MMVEPITQMMHPIIIDFFRPRISLRYPETRAPTQEPAGMAAVMPPWVEAVGPEHVRSLEKGGPLGPWLK